MSDPQPPPPSQNAPAEQIDLERLAELVYKLMQEEARREQQRLPPSGRRRGGPR